MPIVYLLSNKYPVPGTAGAVIRYRHMMYEREMGVDFRVIFRDRNGAKTDPNDIQIRAGLLSKLLMKFVSFSGYRGDIKWLDKFICKREASWLSRNIDISLNDTLIMVLEGRYDTYVAYYLGILCNFRFGLILHDASEYFYQTDREITDVFQLNRKLLLDSDIIWSVSQDIVDHYDHTLRSKTVLLPPVGSSHSKAYKLPWKKSHSDAPVVGYAGRVRASQKKALEILAERLSLKNGKLFVVGEDRDKIMPELTKYHENIVWGGLKDSPEIALEALASSCCAIISISPDSDLVRWAQFSFPSKVVEFSALSLPIGIFAPTDYALSHWARDRNWRLLYPTVSREMVDLFLDALGNEDDWTAAAQQVLLTRDHEFNPARILGVFHQSLRKLQIA